MKVNAPGRRQGGSPAGTVGRLGTTMGRLFYLNALWIAFSLAGLVVVGLFPATAALVKVTRRWVVDGEELAVSATFAAIFRKQLLRANVWGYAHALIGGFLAIEVYFLYHRTEDIASALTFVAGLILWVFVAYAIRLVQLTTYEQSTLQIVRAAGLSLLRRPFPALVSLFVLALWIVVLSLLPALAPICGASLPAFLLITLGRQSALISPA